MAASYAGVSARLDERCWGGALPAFSAWVLTSRSRAHANVRSWRGSDAPPALNAGSATSERPSIWRIDD